MVDHIVDASKPRGRVEIQVGAGHRRRWSDEVKGRIVAASYAPGAVVSEVARRHGISPQHLCVPMATDQRWRDATERIAACRADGRPGLVAFACPRRCAADRDIMRAATD